VTARYDVAALAVGLFMLLLFVPMIPATVPVALTVVRLAAGQVDVLRVRLDRVNRRELAPGRSLI
jgi:hypothetical protein